MKTVYNILLLFFYAMAYCAAGEPSLFETSRDAIRSIRFLKTATLLLTESKKLKRRSLSEIDWQAVPIVDVVQDVIVSEVNTDYAIALDSTHVCTTTDSGANWLQVTFDSTTPHGHTNKALGRIESAKIHPSFPDWILFAIRDKPGCVEDSDDLLEDLLTKRLQNVKRTTKKKCLKRLYLTKDFGKTVEIVPVKVFDYEWSYSRLNRIFALIPASSLSTFASPDLMDAVYSDDFFMHAQQKHVLSQGVTRLVAAPTYTSSTESDLEEFVFVEEPNLVRSFRGPAAKVLISTDHGVTFHKARLPTTLTSFNILDTSEGQVFLSVATAGAEMMHRESLYMSDALGTNYSLSLSSLENPQKEFIKVDAGVEGVYIANVLEEDGRIMTMITHDKGATWSRLPVPSGEDVPEECRSDRECTLHLTGLADTLLASPDALGFVVATGNIGRHLVRQSQRTFLSRDSGVTWEQLKPDGPRQFAIGDSGGILVLIDSVKATKQVEYSYDQGLTWQVQQLPVTLSVTGVETEQGRGASGGARFLVLGTRTAGETGVVATVDLGVGQVKCTEGDYEVWTTGKKQQEGEGCLMGREISFWRRKRTVACTNGGRNVRQEVRICECAEGDYECDVGYKRSHEVHECIRDDAIDLNYTLVEPPSCDDVFTISRGYRKIAGDMCKGGVNHKPLFMKCTSKGMRSKGWFLLFIIALLAFGVVKGGNRAGKILNDQSTVLREANWLERLRERVESAWYSSLPTWASKDKRDHVAYQIVGSGQDAPDVHDLFFEEEEPEGEEIREIEAGVIVEKIHRASSPGDAWMRKNHNFQLHLPYQRTHARSAVPSRAVDLGDDV